MQTGEPEDKVWIVPVLFKMISLIFMTLSQTDQDKHPFRSPYYVYSVICLVFIGRSRDISRKKKKKKKEGPLQSSRSSWE